MATTTSSAPDDAMASLSISTWFLSSQWSLFIDNRIPSATLVEKVSEIHQRVQHHYGSDSDKHLVVLDRFDFVLRSLPNLRALVGDAGSNEAAYSYCQLVAAKLMSGATAHEHTTLKLVDATCTPFEYQQTTKVGSDAEQRIKLLLDHIERRTSLKGTAPRLGSARTIPRAQAVYPAACRGQALPRLGDHIPPTWSKSSLQWWAPRSS